jgi:hypothetical protein
MPFTSVSAEKEMPVVFETSKVAVSEGSFGTVCGIQLAAVFQSPEVGLLFHVALAAKTVVPKKPKTTALVTRRSCVLVRLGRWK